MNNYKLDLNCETTVNQLQVAVRREINNLTNEYWELHGPDATAVQLDTLTAQREQYRVYDAQLEVAYETSKHKAWNALSDGSAYDKAQAAVRRAQIELAKVKVDDALETLQDAQTQLTDSRRAERAARTAA